MRLAGRVVGAVGVFVVFVVSAQMLVLQRFVTMLMLVMLSQV
jgi:hypothetical protein